MCKIKNILYGTLIVSLVVSMLTCSDTSDSDSEDVYRIPSSVDGLSLDTLTAYYEGGESSNAIDIGIFFELPQDQSIKASDLKGYVDSLITGSFSFMRTEVLSAYNFNIYVGYVASSNDKSYTIPETMLTKVQEALLARKDALFAATTAAELENIYNEVLASAMQDQGAGFNLDNLFGYLNPLDANKDLYQFGDITDAPVATTDPSQYTEDEKNILVKRNIGRIAQLFEQYDHLDVWAIVSQHTQGYTYIPPQNTTIYDMPIIFQEYYHPFLKLVSDNSFARIFGHELGHVLGNFVDEYYKFEEDENLKKELNLNCVSEGAVLQDGSVFNDISDTTKNPYSGSQLQRHYEQLTNGIAETKIVYDIPGPVSGYDGSLFQGCAAEEYKSYRTFENSIMSFHYNLMTADEWKKGFGAVHKHYIDWYMKNQFKITPRP